MISSKKDLIIYLQSDDCANKKVKISNYGLIRRVIDAIILLIHPGNNYYYIRALRYEEYHTNLGGAFHKMWGLYFRYLRKKLCIKTNIELVPNCAGPGLVISHGNCVISAAAKLGSNCKILSGVTIGGQGRYDVPGAPTLGNRVFVGTGAKVLGPIKIADDVVIGANAVVTKDILEPGITVVGMPAKKINNGNSYNYLYQSNKQAEQLKSLLNTIEVHDND